MVWFEWVGLFRLGLVGLNGMRSFGFHWVGLGCVGWDGFSWVGWFGVFWVGGVGVIWVELGWLG